MGISYGRQRIRLAIDVTSVSDALDAITSSSPHIWRGTDVQFEISAWWGTPGGDASDVIDVTNVSSLTFEVKTSVTGTTIMSATLASGAMNASLTKETWLDGSSQHVTVPFTNAETAPSLGGAASLDYYVVVTVVTNDSPPREITWGKTTLRIEEDGHGAVTTPPLGDPSYLTAAETAALIGAAKFSPLLLYNQTTGQYAQVQIIGTGASRQIVFGTESA
jgi:hypothetical protein